ncbi:TetR/AcrR family transcriptional regulator [Xanthocytophaga agilis]|uniref:TetR family transcriptional regulator C-terminal domain-containing protein n=1 Tax=Xanthocytophaga agilis TaxID=3048010 RepID=A0AAE3UJ33_9BACT|nr:TetR family transcriptional regulator C-terminal domain-containing protein [Xanthocytophaga agilis]MDJ1506221.1 TetR family transcriptional regulator C-terminal domain-containing protein [Xanthocytophaga agilis]
MRGRPTTFDNEQVLQKAQQVFWTKGYTATSLDDLLNVMKMGSGSFYNIFKGGKKELFRKAIQQRRDAFEEFKAELYKSESPIDLIKDFFRSIASADMETHLKGCIISNTVVEMTFIDQELENEAIEILKEVETMFTLAIRKAQADGTIKNNTDAAILGKYLITFWNGINVTRRMYPNNTILLKQIEMQLEIIS